MLSTRKMEQSMELRQAKFGFGMNVKHRMGLQLISKAIDKELTNTLKMATLVVSHGEQEVTNTL